MTTVKRVLAYFVCALILSAQQAPTRVNPWTGKPDFFGSLPWSSDPAGASCAPGSLVTYSSAIYICNGSNVYAALAGGSGLAGLGTYLTGTLTVPDVNTALIPTREVAVSGVDSFFAPTSASGTAYVGNMTGNALTAYTDGMVITFRPDVDCGLNPTVNINTRGVRNLKEIDGTIGMTCRAGHEYKLAYRSSLPGFTNLDPVIMRSLGVTVDGGGSAITTGVKGYIVVPFNCTIKNWSVVADQTGSIVFDVWKHTSVPSVANTITAAAKPTLSSAQLAVAQAPTGWTTTVSSNDVLGFNVDSAATVTRVTLTIGCQR